MEIIKYLSQEVYSQKCANEPKDSLSRKMSTSDIFKHFLKSTVNGDQFDQVLYNFLANQRF